MTVPVVEEPSHPKGDGKSTKTATVPAQNIPIWVAEKLGVPANEVAFLEISKAQSQLYVALLEFIYHRGVDINQKAMCALEKPPSDTPCIGREYPGRLSAISVANVINNYDPPEKKIKSEEDGTKSDSNSDHIASVVNSCNTLKDGFEKEALDEIAAINISSDGSVSKCIDSESPAEIKPIAKENEKSKDEEDKESADTTKNTSLYDIKPPMPTFQFGLGKARLNFGSDDIYAAHEMLGLPIFYYNRFPPPTLSSYRDFESIFDMDDEDDDHGNDKDTTRLRMLYLYAREPETLKKVSSVALKWSFERHKGQFDPKAGMYLLYIMKNLIGCTVWQRQGWKPSRPLSSVILPPGQMDKLITDICDFRTKDTRRWYQEHGLPYRRSYLFHGPPGVGKTSTIRALAGELKLNPCFMSFGDDSVGCREVEEALCNMPKSSSMLVIEDVDSLFTEKRKSDVPSPITFSGLLNVLDGLVATEGMITVMTTNHIERLDPALVRAGRVDRRIQFKAPTAEQISTLFLSFYPDASPELAAEFSKSVLARPEKEARSIATLQEHFIYTRTKTARESVDELVNFFEEFYPGGGYDSKYGLYV